MFSLKINEYPPIAARHPFYRSTRKHLAFILRNQVEAFTLPPHEFPRAGKALKKQPVEDFHATRWSELKLAGPLCLSLAEPSFPLSLFDSLTHTCDQSWGGFKPSSCRFLFIAPRRRTYEARARCSPPSWKLHVTAGSARSLARSSRAS